MNARFRVVTAVAASAAIAACKTAPPETHGFIATLGNDTTSVERVTRTGNRIVSDAVGRSPVVVRRHWEATLAADGTIRHWTMDTYLPNAGPDAAELHHTADFTDDAVRLSTRTPSGTRNVSYKKKYAVTVPWNAFIYGTYEVLFDMARTRPDSTSIGQYFFEGWDEGHVGMARVRKLGSGDYSITSTGLAGAGVGHLDESGRMLSYSGQGTTYKQEVHRVADVPNIDTVTARFAADEKAKGVAHSLSTRDTTRAIMAGTTISVDYSRPLARGRALVGGLIPYGQVWRTGANAATQLSVSQPIRLGGIGLDSGTYTLWTLPTNNAVQLVVNRQHGQWGTSYQAQSDIARADMHVDTVATPVEQFTIRVETGSPGDGARVNERSHAGRLVMEWGTFRWSVPITMGR